MSTIEIYGKLDREAFDRALDEIVQRHEPLRTTYALVDGEALQQVNVCDDVLLEHLDLRGNEEMDLVAATVNAGPRPHKNSSLRE
jgi:hypothetical protein